MTLNKTIGQIAELIDGEVIGDKDVLIKGVSGIKEAQPGDLTFLANPKYAHLMDTTKASCVITSKDTKPKEKLNLIRIENPDFGFAKMVSLIAPCAPSFTGGASKLSSISKNARLGTNVTVSPFVVIEDGAEIGNDTAIYAGAYIGHDVKIGNNVLIYPNVSIRERCIIGNSVIIHSGAVVGSDGFGFATVEGVHHKIPQIGIVVIEDDVEIGANVAIDRARFGRTLIGRGTKIDNLVQIAHNVAIGENSIIVAQAGVSGSTKLGKGVIMAGQSGVVGHIEIGDKVIIAAQSGVTKSVDSDLFVIGSPAKPQNIWKRINASVARLPRLFKTVGDLKGRLEALEKRIGQKKANNT